MTMTMTMIMIMLSMIIMIMLSMIIMIMLSMIIMMMLSMIIIIIRIKIKKLFYNNKILIYREKIMDLDLLDIEFIYIFII